MLGGKKAAILAQVGHFYFGRWVSFTSIQSPSRCVGIFYAFWDAMRQPIDKKWRHINCFKFLNGVTLATG